MKRIITVLTALTLTLALNTTVFASDTGQNVMSTTAYGDTLSVENKDIILNQLKLNEEDLTTEDKIALFGSGVVWNETYGSTTASIRKSLSMTANLTSTSNLPYTTIRVTNKSNYSITAVAYKGTVGSTQLRSMTVSPNSTNTMTIPRSDVVRYGTMNIQGTTSSLSYTVSMYNAQGNFIPCSVYAVKYN